MRSGIFRMWYSMRLTALSARWIPSSRTEERGIGPAVRTWPVSGLTDLKDDRLFGAVDEGCTCRRC